MAKEISRDDELSTKPAIRKRLLELYKDIEKSFLDQNGRADEIMDYWDMYNCQLNERQFYSGNSHIFVPIVKDAIKARKTRFTNQIFPQSGRYVEVTTENGDVPHATMAVLEHYVRAAKLRTQVVPALVVNGDVEGQYSIYVTWEKTLRHVVSRETRGLESDGLQFRELGEIEDITEETIVDAGPCVEVLNDCDLSVIPATADSIDAAIACGGAVTVMRRWTKDKIRKLKEDGEIVADVADELMKTMAGKDRAGKPDTPKDNACAAGIKTQGTSKFVLVYETWANIKVGGKMRLCRTWYGGSDQVLGCKLNPYWCDLCPVISAPVEKVSNVFKGRAPMADVIDMQVFANDTVNEGADTAHFSAMPIIMTDPEKNPKVGTMVLGLAAVWETNPKDTQFAQFPPLWEKSFEIVASCKNQIFQTLGVNPSMIAQNTGMKNKRNQAEIAAEQQVDILTTADSVINIEEGILTPMLQRFAAYDHQFRDKAITVKQFGEMGLRANMADIPPIQMNHRYEFRWFGVEAARNAQQIQQQIAMANVFKGVPPQMYAGYRLNMAPLMVQLAENAFGPRLAPLIFEDTKSQLSVDPQMENEMLQQGIDVMVHPMDDDVKHLQAHMPLMAGGDPHGVIRSHIIRHQMQMQAKAQEQQKVAGLPGTPGGSGPGVAGTPKEGGQVEGPRLLKGPPGTIPQDQMVRAGAPAMPRKM